MGLESATTISGLNASWPLGTDPRNQIDDHFQLIKGVLKAQFPGSGGGFSIPITALEAEINFLTGVTSNIQSQLNTLNSGKADNNNLTYVGHFIGSSDYFNLDSGAIFKEASGKRIGINNTSPDVNLHVKHNGASQQGIIALFETTAGTLDPSIVIKNFNGGSAKYIGLQVRDDGSLSFEQALQPAGAGTQIAAIRIDKTVKANNVPEVVGRYTSALNATPSYSSRAGTAPSLSRASTGSYTLTFTGYSNIYSVNLEAVDANNNINMSINSISGNAVSFKFYNGSGTLFDPDAGMSVTCWCE